MAEETKVEETTEQNATVEEIDYAKELEETQRKAEAARLGFASRKARKEIEQPTEELESNDEIADKVLAKILPAINSATQSNLIESKLNSLAGDNQALKSLIKYHMDNTVNSSLDLNERAEAAYAIANKKVIAKTLKEINTATQNRSQISNIGQGANQDTYARPNSNTVSDAQKTALKAQAEAIGRGAGWSQKQKDDFVTKAIENLARAR